MRDMHSLKEAQPSPTQHYEIDTQVYVLEELRLKDRHSLQEAQLYPTQHYEVDKKGHGDEELLLKGEKGYYLKLCLLGGTSYSIWNPWVAKVADVALSPRHE